MIDEGYIKFDIDWTQTGPICLAEVDELNRWREPLMAAGLIGHYDDLGIGYGNISVRLAHGRGFIISGTQTGHIVHASGEHYALVTGFDIGANRIECQGSVKASSESLTHAAIYAADPGINAVVHVHQPRLWSELRGALPATDPRVAYGTPAMALELERLCRDPEFRKSGIAVMAGHESGLIAVGPTLADAATRILELNAESGAAG
ncbi:MAG: class II aldolase/adducin family protein [Gammaproteobacteria bacterium]|nr:class II aldolase/adducin family protein [Gammaproteobacteria bacterium]MDH4255260.1 class II aldolase/adducin family protein [Gammaproteobacteria bacterium]MDH5309992.1 class II aldolase/adducin family protein [Gammaproteobacteria bacterium]